MPSLLCCGQGCSFIRPPAQTEAVTLSWSVHPSVNVSLRLWLSLRETVRLRVSVSSGFCSSVGLEGVCAATAGLLVVRVTVCLDVCRRLSRAPSGPRGLWVSVPREEAGEEVAAPGGGEGRGRRQWAEAGAQSRAGGGVCGGPEAAAVRVCSASAGEHRPPPAPGAARPGPAWPSQVSLPPRPGPSPSLRPLPRPGHSALPEGSRPPNLTPTAPPGLPSGAPATSHSSLTLRSPLETYGRLRREPAPQTAGCCPCSRFPMGTPERP